MIMIHSTSELCSKCSTKFPGVEEEAIIEVSESLPELTLEEFVTQYFPDKISEFVDKDKRD